MKHPVVNKVSDVASLSNVSSNLLGLSNHKKVCCSLIFHKAHLDSHGFEEEESRCMDGVVDLAGNSDR